MTEPVLPRFMAVPAGTYQMGSSGGMPNERPLHEVQIDAFELARLPVSNLEFRIFLEQTSSPPPPHIDQDGFSAGDQPVVGTSWFQARDYVLWLDDLDDSHEYGLPTEAEREWAARGGLPDPVDYPWGQGPPAWEEVYSRKIHDGSLTPPRMPFGEPNGYGLYHMGDLVHEWCSDVYDRNYYDYSPRDNPKGAFEGERCSSRGGSWRHAVKYTRIQARSSIPPDRQFSDYGFRVSRYQR